MRHHVSTALLALCLAGVFALPQNMQEVSQAADNEASVAKQKGDARMLEMMADSALVRTCYKGECRLMRASSARQIAPEDITSLSANKGQSEVAKTLEPGFSTMQESMKGLGAQRALLANLQAEIAQMSSAFNKGQQAAESAKGQFAATMTKGLSYSAPAAAPVPSFMSKGNSFARPPSKGSSAANTMQLEAAMCPMTMYELGKAQKLVGEMRSQVDNLNRALALKTSQKNQLTTSLTAATAMKMRAEQQAAFNAKYAAEQKARADSLERALAQANMHKSYVEQQKAQLEGDLSASQNALVAEKQNSMALAAALRNCQVNKFELEAETSPLIKELEDTQEELRGVQKDLEDEQNAHGRTQRQLQATQRELTATEEARQSLEQANEQLDAELSETKSQLEATADERDQLQESLELTNDALTQCNEEKMGCQANLSQEKAITSQLTSQLQDAMSLLESEKNAREELTETIMAVKAASEKIQEEVQRLQEENVQLEAQVSKLQSEQEAAMALAAGCPPQYEKFGLSCYKYVREKTQWREAQTTCMRDNGNLVALESRQEQAFIVDYLKRHGAESKDAYSLTSGYKSMSMWKWKGSDEKHIGESGPEYWYNMMTKMKPGYDCQGMYLSDATQYGKWVGLPCYSAAPYVCEYNLAPPGTPAPANMAETIAVMGMYREAPAYLSGSGYSKGSFAFAAPSNSKGFQAAAAPSYGSKGFQAAAAPSYGSKGFQAAAAPSYGSKGFSFRRS